MTVSPSPADRCWLRNSASSSDWSPVYSALRCSASAWRSAQSSPSGSNWMVVEVADGRQGDRIGLVEDLVVVEQPPLVVADLDRWVEDAPDLLADVQLDAVVGGRRTDAAVAPLLELDDDRVLGARRGVAGEHRVEPPARVAELVLEDDAVVVQLGLVDEHRQRHEAVLPARHLVGRGPVADLRRELGAQLLRDPMHLRIGPKLLGCPGVELHRRAMPSMALMASDAPSTSWPIRSQ